LSGDKSTGQIVVGITGAVIGAYAGGPTGALYGYQIGSGLGGFIDPPPGPTIEGPRLNDLAAQTASYGTHIPRLYSTMQVHGNVFWLENNQLRERAKKTQQGGKGGGGSATVKTYTYYATFAVSICEGPIEAISKIWINGKLKYNAGSSDLDTVIASNKNADGFRIYYGTDDQLPDARMEADVGMANCPAYRGLAYIVFYDLELTDYGNTLQGAQVKVEVFAKSTNSGPRNLETIEVDSDITPDITGNYWANYFFQNGKDATCNFSYAVSASPTPLGRTKRVRRYDNGAESSSFDFSSNPQMVVGTTDIDVLMYMPRVGGYNSVAGEYIVVNGFIYYPTNRTGDMGIKANSGYFTYKNGHLYACYRTTESGGFFNYAIERLVPGVNNALSVVATSSTYAAATDNSIAYAVDDDGSVLVAHKDGIARLDGSNLIEVDSSAEILSPANEGYGYFDSGRFYVFDRTTNGNIYVVEDLELVETFVNPLSGSLGLEDERNLYVVKGGICCYMRTKTSTDMSVDFHYFDLRGGDSVGTTILSDIVSAEFEKSELIKAADIDVTDLTDEVRGFRVPGIMSPRSAVSPLQGAYPFDIIPSGYKIKCVRRGKSSVKSISADDLDAREWGSQAGTALSIDREMDSQLPRKVVIRHLDPARNGDLNEQYSAEKTSSAAANIREFEMPLSLTADEAAQVAEVLWDASWLERDRFEFSLPPTHLDLEPGDVINLSTDYADFVLRLDSIQYGTDGKLTIGARPASASLWLSSASGGQGSVDDETIPIVASPVTVLMDLPLIRDQDDTYAFAAAMAGVTTSWSGGVLFRSVDQEQTWTDIQAFAGSVPIGFALNALPADDGYVIDRSGELNVSLLAGELSSITEAQMLTGLHWCAYGSVGRWELIRYATATLESDGSYTLSTLVRGARGTEWAAGLHEIGDTFVFLDDADMAGILMPAELLGVELDWRGISIGQTVEDGQTQEFTYAGNNLKPLSPVHISGAKSSGDWVIEWTRRSRYTSSFWRTGVTRPLGEASESYEVDILDGSTVVRTLTSTTPTVTYTDAQQIADFGSSQSQVDLAIYQMSATVGRGYAGAAELAGDSDDPYFSNVSALLHFDGANGSTVFGDVKGNSWSAVGDAQISTAQAKFGQSLYLDGSGDSIQTPNNSGFDFGTNDLTIEAWIYVQGSGDRTIYSAINGSTGITFRVTAAGKLQYLYGGGLNANAGATTITASTWTHVALCRSGTAMKIFVDGVEDASFSAPENLTSSGTTLAVGRHRALNIDYFNGYIDELRVTKGFARYAAGFTPPAAPFPD
jgi:hypothetical protein